MGNTLRGALGISLFRNHCKLDNPQCDSCKDGGSCPYVAVFKTKNQESIPNPYVISVSYPGKSNYQSGEFLIFSITLFGAAVCYEDDIIEAIEKMSIGKIENTTIELLELRRREWHDDVAPKDADSLRLDFITPTEIYCNKKMVTELDFFTFRDSLFRRLAGVINHYGEREFVLPYQLMTEKPRIETISSLNERRFYTSQQPINGVVGSVRYFGEISRYLPYIELGKQLHLGKKTTRSCGQYDYII